MLWTVEGNDNAQLVGWLWSTASMRHSGWYPQHLALFPRLFPRLSSRVPAVSSNLPSNERMIFNVSVGDFICVINLIIEIIGALEQSHGAASQFQDLMGMFESLKDAINETGSPDCNSDALAAALKRAEHSVERFLKKIEKYQPSL
jgi:hypothetical protein